MKQYLSVPAVYAPAEFRTVIGVDRNGDVGLALDGVAGEAMRVRLTAEQALNVMAALHEVMDPYLMRIQSERSAGVCSPRSESKAG